jgi:hypothetical protein
MATAGFSQEQLQDNLKKGYNIAKANVQILNEAGLFKMDHIKVFTVELVKPLSPELFNVAALQQIILAQASDMNVRALSDLLPLSSFCDMLAFVVLAGWVHFHECACILV